jgi:hypothetical protein
LTCCCAATASTARHGPDVARLEAVITPLEMRLPDEIDDIDVVERADHRLKERLALFRGLARRQRRDAVEHHLIGLGLVMREHPRGLGVEYRRNPS